jgi:hypothetical protein
MFWVRGKLSRSSEIRRVTWHDGEIGGDALIGYRVRQLAKQREGVAVSLPTGPATYHNHLADPLSALALIAETFDGGIVESGGDLPRLPDIPDGAIA